MVGLKVLLKVWLRVRFEIGLSLVLGFRLRVRNMVWGLRV